MAFSPRQRRRTGSVITLLGIVTLASAAFLPSAEAADNPTPYSSNLKCADLGFDNEFKINGQPANGTYEAGDGSVQPGTTLPDGFEVIITNVTVNTTLKQVHFDWEVNDANGDFPIQTVLVKVANGGQRWDYPNGEDADHAYSTKDSISHVNFCWDDEVTTTTEEETTTTEEETTTTEEETTTTEEETTTTDDTSRVNPSVDPTTDESVLPEVINRPELPRTGVNHTALLAEVGAAMVLLGLGLTRLSKPAKVGYYND